MTSRSGGLSKARLGRMRDVMAAHVERGDIPGLVTLVSRRDEVHVEAIGRPADGGGPMRRDTIFRIASMTIDGYDGGAGRHPDDPGHVDLPPRPGRLSRLLDPGLSGDRRLKPSGTYREMWRCDS
jgi:hypothetical protein